MGYDYDPFDIWRSVDEEMKIKAAESTPPPPEPEQVPRCIAITKAGKKCTLPAVKGEEYCMFHIKSVRRMRGDD